MTNLEKIYKKIPIKNLITYSLIILSVNGYLINRNNYYLLEIFISLFIIVGIDSFYILLKFKRIDYSRSSIITALILSGILPATSIQSLKYILIASLGAVLSKHLITYKGKSILNPAGFGGIIFLLFSKSYLSWSISENTILVILLGLFVAFKGNFIEYIVNYIGILSLLYTVYILFNFSKASIIYNNFFIASLFFIFFMLTDPKTMPFKKDLRFIVATFGGIASFALSLLNPSYFLLLSLMIMNLISFLINYNLLEKFYKKLNFHL
jgi:Na+-transporting NADH:ubiquinone oxidoreductase subunit NqrB